jgi:hypothetical protein
MFPNLNPRHNQADIPTNPAPVITSTVTASEAEKLMVINHEPSRNLFFQPVNFENGYGLERYTAEVMPPTTGYVGICYVPHITISELMVNVKRFFLSKAYILQLERLHPALYKQMYDFREHALAARRLRHRLVRKYGGWYVWLWWFGHTPNRADAGVSDNPHFHYAEAEMMLKNQPGSQINATEASDS